MADSILPPNNNEEAPFDSRRFLIVFWSVVLSVCLILSLAVVIVLTTSGDSLQNSIELYLENTPTP